MRRAAVQSLLAFGGAPRMVTVARVPVSCRSTSSQQPSSLRNVRRRSTPRSPSSQALDTFQFKNEVTSTPMRALRAMQCAAQQQRPLLFSVPSSAPARRPWPGALLSGRYLSSVAPVPPPRPLSPDGQALAERYVDDSGQIQNDDVKWYRAEEMDPYAADLVNQHQGSLELEELDARGANLPPGAMSSNGAIEHIGEGVQVGRTDRTKVDTQIDPDSLRTPHTITRVDLRATARQAVKTVDDPRNFPRVTVVGQAGIGKTRGGLAYTLQLLLWRGEVVIRVGHKDDKAYMFVPDENGKYRVWETKASDWNRSRVAVDRRAYALIDPSESGPYADVARCHVIKWASNNAPKHYPNWSKDGHLLVAAMATLEEVLVMVPFLWDDRATPYPHQLADDPGRFDSLEARREEIKKRCELAGTILRVVFDHEKFTSHVRAVAARAKGDGMKMEPASLLSHLRGAVTTAEGDQSSVSSLLYLFGPGPDGPKTMIIKFNPVAMLLLRRQLEVTISAKDYEQAYAFETLTTAILQQGGEFDGVIMPKRTLVTPRPKNWQETATAILNLPDNGEQLVVASPTFPVLDQAASRFVWFNAKTGKGIPTVKAMAFVTLMTKWLEVAKLDDKGGLTLVGDCAAANLTSPGEKLITLTFLLSQMPEGMEPNQYIFADGTKKLTKRDGIERHTVFGLVKKFFEEHVDVKTIDCSNANVCPLTEADVEFMDRMARLLREYRILESW